MSDVLWWKGERAERERGLERKKLGEVVREAWAAWEARVQRMLRYMEEA